jgi:2-polyprenyl-3-methyl-5-hydroxy-6-metoxy-1,4-benzoquinol methylase
VVQKAALNEEKHEEFHRDGRQAAEIDLDSMSDSYAERNLTDVRRRVSSLRSKLRGDEQLLDFGTGMGHFLEAISPYVESVVGSEINQERLAFIREELGFDVYEGTDALVNAFGEDSFDVLTMYHTLEHLPNPVEQLKRVRTLLSPDGLLVVEVPNHDDWLLGWLSAYADFYYQEAHAYYFTPDTLKATLGRAGFEAEVQGVQRYSYQNVLHWFLEGKPELGSPSRHQAGWHFPLDTLYENILSRMEATDTIVGWGRVK